MLIVWNLNLALQFSANLCICAVTGDLVNIILDAVFILGLRWGVSGAAISHVISQLSTIFIICYCKWFYDTKNVSYMIYLNLILFVKINYRYLISLLLLLKLAKMVQFVPSSIHDLEFSRFLKCGKLQNIRLQWIFEWICWFEKWQIYISIYLNMYMKIKIQDSCYLQEW